MKKTISIAFATFALLSFASCQKDNAVLGTQGPALRTVTAVFEGIGKKTTLDDDAVTPLWSVGDKIRVLDASAFEDITLTSDNIENDGRTITFTTVLEGETLYAVYPASATSIETCNGSITFAILTSQDGTFASANICVAKGDDKDNLLFSNATSILEFSQTAASTGVLRVSVTAANAIAGTLTATFGDNNRATVSPNSLTGKIIWTTAPAAAQDKYYVAVAPVATGAVDFRYYKALTEAVESKDSKTLTQNKIYELAIPTDGYENSYIEIGGMKWAKCNIGATTVSGSYETCYGDLYQWGSVNTLYEGSPWTSATSVSFNWKAGKTDGFTDGNREYTYESPLPTDKDVAKQKLGSGWRMPTSGEFSKLASACGYSSEFFTPSSADNAEGVSAKGVYYCSNYSGIDGIKGLLFVDGSGNRLFFPVAGYFEKTRHQYPKCGFYWSKSLDRTDPDDALRLNIDDKPLVNTSAAGSRTMGGMVRPVSD